MVTGRAGRARGRAVRRTGARVRAAGVAVPAGRWDPAGRRVVATYFSNVTLFDGHSVETKAGVLVSDGNVTWKGSHRSAPRETRGAEEVDGTGKLLARGLFAQEADGADGVRAAVREQFRAGARSIKIIATGGVLTPGIAVDFTAFTPEELDAAVDEAHRWDRPVAAHAHGRTGIENAVRAGVDSIEHGSQIEERVAELMKEKGTFHVPTITALRQIVEHPEEVPAYAVEKGRQMAEWAEESF